ncbi:nuclease-related domain-containing protein [Micromonospora vinacea]|uniref:nuclease-related domain-containing protein n=1 Tax=Micromonospora vinacea TaxID=709878 RepID=UPI00344B7577
MGDAPAEHLRLGLHAAAARFGAAKLTDGLADELAASVGAMPEKAAAAVEAMTTMLGSQSVNALAAPNRLSAFPIVGVPDGRRAWPKPQDFLHGAISWLDQLLLETGNARLRQTFHRARDKATETLIEQTLGNVFGARRVHRGLEYQLSDDTWAETDIVVILPGTALVVEAKAHAMTAPGRAGRRDRVERHLKELLRKPLQQSERTKEALLRGTQWRHRGRPFEMPVINEVTRVVVTFEVIDPFVTLAHLVADPDMPDAWVVSLSSLMMVADVLTHPVELYAYAATRAAVIAAGQPIVFMESDALAAWYRNREGVWDDLGGAVFQLAYQSDELNEYFTSHRLAVKGYAAPVPPRPSAGIPDYVLRAVDDASSAPAASWGVLACIVAAVKPAQWRKIDRRIRAVNSAPTRRARKRARQASSGIQINSQLILRVGEFQGATLHDVGETCELFVRL